MRSIVALAVLLGGCATAPVGHACGELSQPYLIDCADLAGSFQHHAVVIRSSEPSLVGDERSNDVTFEITEDALIARAEDDQVALVMRIDALVDVREGTSADSGERCLRIVDSDRPPEERSHLRLDPSQNLWVDARYVPVAPGAQPVAFVDSDAETSLYPRRTATGVEWTFISSYFLDGRTLDVHHTLVRD